MALDVQRNWTVSMEKSRPKTKRRTSDTANAAFVPTIPSSDLPVSRDTRTQLQREAVYLPTEIIFHILDYVPHNQTSQKTLHSCCPLSRQWYACAIRRLYERPYLYGKNFDPFVATICPSINAHIRKSELAELVRRLDMGGLVHHGSKSLTARLLGRTKDALEEFVAPQASFAINCFAALSKCTRLRTLDLSLVSESIPLPTLFHTLRSLTKLTTLRFPRSANYDTNFEPSSCTWPPALESLYLSGGISQEFLTNVSNFPSTLMDLTIEHCPFAKAHRVRHMLSKLGSQLRSLTIGNMRQFDPGCMDMLPRICPKLGKLSIPVDYLSELSFTTSEASISYPQAIEPLSLVFLELTGLGESVYTEDYLGLSALDICSAIDDGTLPHLRTVRVARSLGWHVGVEAAEELEDLIARLDEKAAMD
ncbi:hypothetical protein LTR04_000265, partial [Oleoguttula sp. CCFEE 6159]